MSFPRPIQWYHSHADLIWPDGTFKAQTYTTNAKTYLELFFFHQNLLAYSVFQQVLAQILPEDLGDALLVNLVENARINICRCNGRPVPVPRVHK
jgi:hypothetical protein